MKIADIIKKANRNTWNRKLRSILTILSVTVGATTLTLAVALGSGAENLVQSSINNSELRDAVVVNKLPLEIVQRIEQFEQDQDEGVPEFNPQALENGEQSPTGNATSAEIVPEDIDQISAITGTETVYPIYNPPALYITLEGKSYLAQISSAEPNTTYKPLQGEAITSNEQAGLLLSKMYAESLHIPEQDLVGKTATVTFINRDTGKTASRTLPVVGVMSDAFVGYQSYANYDTMVAVAKELGLQTTTRAVVTLEPEYSNDESLLNVSEMIKGANKQFRVSSTVADRGEAYTVIKVFRIGLISFASIVLLAALFGISNTLFTSVLERTQDIGLMRALGAKRSNIFAMFAMESALIGFWGAIVGIAIGFTLGFIGNRLLQHFQPEVFTGEVSLLQFNPLYMLGIVAALSFIAFLAGTLPARKAARTNVIDALRYE